MSKHWGYVCRSHDPELASELWINHGEVILSDVAVTFRGGGWPTSQYGDPIGFYYDGLAWTAPIEWLRQHPRCDIALRSEYGDTQEISAARLPISHPNQG